MTMNKQEENRAMVRFFNTYVEGNGIGGENHIFSMDELNNVCRTWSPIQIAAGVSVGHFDVKDKFFTYGRGDVYGLKIDTFTNWYDESSPMSLTYPKTVVDMKNYFEKLGYKATIETIREALKKAFEGDE